MKKFALAVVLLTAMSAAAQLTTVTGTVKDLNGNIVTSGSISFTLQPPYGASISGTAFFSPHQVTCLIINTGAVKANDGVSACTVAQNTTLSPAGTYYQIQVCPYNACTGSFNWYAFSTTQDMSSVVPTPATISPLGGVFQTITLAQTVAPFGNLGVCLLWDQLVSQRLTVNCNSAGVYQLVTNAGDINTSDQVASTHLSAPLPRAQGGTEVSSTATFPTVGVVVTEAATETLSGKSFGGGIGNDGSGFKHKRFGVSCTTAAAIGAFCSTAYSWTTAFADANYTVTCTSAGAASGVPTVISAVPAAGTVTVFFAALTAAAAQASGVDCIAVHD